LGRRKIERPGDDRGFPQFQEGVLCLKFNGWRFQGFEDAKIALIEGIVTGLIEKRPLLTKATDAVRNILHRIDLLKAAKKTGGLALTAYAGLHGLGASALAIPVLLNSLEGWVTDPTKLTKENVESALSGAKGPSAVASGPREALRALNLERLAGRFGLSRNT
jgi:hypothetical protein